MLSTRLFFYSAITAMILGLCPSAHAAIIARFDLVDHPDGAEAPPPYGLRMDRLFELSGITGATGGVVSFSFVDMELIVRDVGGGSLQIEISGLMEGGTDDGATYGFGAGDYQLEMIYSQGVQASGSGWTVDPPNNLNQGTITALAAEWSSSVPHSAAR